MEVLRHLRQCYPSVLLSTFVAGTSPNNGNSSIHDSFSSLRCQVAQAHVSQTWFLISGGLVGSSSSEHPSEESLLVMEAKSWRVEFPAPLFLGVLRDPNLWPALALNRETYFCKQLPWTPHYASPFQLTILMMLMMMMMMMVVVKEKKKLVKNIWS